MQYFRHKRKSYIESLKDEIYRLNRENESLKEKNEILLKEFEAHKSTIEENRLLSQQYKEALADIQAMRKEYAGKFRELINKMN